MKPEERVVVYGSLGLRKGISDLLWAFRKSRSMEEFPAYLDDHPFQVINRIREERNSGIKSADVVLMPHYAVDSLGREGLLSQNIRKSPGLGAVKETGSWATPVGVTFMAMAYNSKLVGPKEVPPDLDALEDPRWAGKLGLQSLTASRSGNLGVWYLSFLRKKVGEQRWKSFLASLARPNRPNAYDCIDHLLQGLVEGESPLALTVYSLAYFREKLSGSPVSLVPSESIPHMMTFTSAGLLREAEDNPAARRFIDFLFTEKAQSVIGAIPGIAPVLKGTTPSYDFEHDFGPTTEFHPVADEADEIPSMVELFRELKLP